MRIIGLSGKRGVGKTLLANHLVVKHGFIKRSFAQTLKEHCYNIWGSRFNVAPKEEDYSPHKWTPRLFMVEYGHFIRKYDNDYWMNKGIENLSANEKYVFDDVRFSNEYWKLKELGAIVVRIERDKELNIYKTELKDSSEYMLDSYEFDYYITNRENTTQDRLFARGDYIVNEKI